MRYFDWRGQRLFRLTETNSNERWDPKTSSWVILPTDVVYREAVRTPSADFKEMSVEEAEKAYAGATTAEMAQEMEDIDWPFTVEMMGKIMAASAGNYDPVQFIKDQKISDTAAPYVLKFWRIVSEEAKALPKGQSLAPPTEWN